MSASKNEAKTVSVVVIGRNEGDRLKVCLESIVGTADCVVYVDSDSSDSSVELAKSMGIDTVELDDSQPYTAARSRNAGFRRVMAQMKGSDFVQFVDGDCIVDSRWLTAAQAFMTSRSDVAAVCGRLRERFPEKSVYNLLCDMEWDQPAGETAACGGNAFMRTEAFRASEGFNESLIAGEEPELCMRLRDSGWKIWRLTDEMMLHDADMNRVSEWSIRAVRAGYTYAEGAQRLGRDCGKQRNRALFWGLALPVSIAVAVVLAGPMALLAGLIYPLQMLRLAMRENFGLRKSLIYAWFETLGKFPEMFGVVKYYFNLARGKRGGLIEYKKPLAAPKNNEN